MGRGVDEKFCLWYFRVIIVVQVLLFHIFMKVGGEEGNDILPKIICNVASLLEGIIIFLLGIKLWVPS